MAALLILEIQKRDEYCICYTNGTIKMLVNVIAGLRKLVRNRGVYMNIKSCIMSIKRRTLYILLGVGIAAVSVGIALFSTYSV